MTDHDPLAPLIERLDRGVEDLDGATRARLARARRRALVESDRRRGWREGLALGGLAVAGLAVVAVLLWQPPSSPAAVPLADVELLASEEYELVEDLEFYLWLAHGGGEATG